MFHIDLRFCDLIMHVEYVGDPKMLSIDRAVGWQGCFPPLSYLLLIVFTIHEVYDLVSVHMRKTVTGDHSSI